MTYKTTFISPIGSIILASDGENLTGLWNENQKYHGEQKYQNMIIQNELDVFYQTKKWLDAYFAGQAPSLKDIHMLPMGSQFRQIVWNILLNIPYGKVITYGDIAKKVVQKTGKQNMSSQAVGGAVGHNPISVIIPCHRVVGSNGSLTGYAGGIQTKIKLLELEGVDISNFFVPKKGTAL